MNLIFEEASACRKHLELIHGQQYGCASSKQLSPYFRQRKHRTTDRRGRSHARRASPVSSLRFQVINWCQRPFPCRAPFPLPLPLPLLWPFSLRRLDRTLPGPSPLPLPSPLLPTRTGTDSLRDPRTPVETVFGLGSTISESLAAIFLNKVKACATT